MVNKKSVSLGVLLVLFMGFSYWVKDNLRDSETLAYNVDEKFKAATFPGFEGNTVNLETVFQNNKITWVNYWATWCGPCRREMPMMRDLYKKFKDQGLEIIAVNVGENRQTIQKYLNEYPLPFPVVMDSNRTNANAINLEVLPTSYMVDSTGTVIRRGTGIQRSWSYFIQSRLNNE